MMGTSVYTAVSAVLAPDLALHTLWLVVAIGLVFSMQGGFLMLEAGSVRTKNAISVTQKNVSDFAVTAVIFLGFSSVIAFGLSLFDTSISGFDELNLLYQMAFCAAAATIVSGAVAERMRFKAYVAITCLTAALIYPVAAAQAWPNLFITERGSWFAAIGFFDHAGSVVVHLLGGCIALAVVMQLGPRIGRYDENGRLQPMNGHSSVLSMGGTFTLWIGWLGFNAGSVSPADPTFGTIITNTALAGCSGAAVTLALAPMFDQGRVKPYAVMTGLIGGLVAITAGCSIVTTAGAIVLGAVGGASALACAHLLARVFKIDDPVDAIATHGAAGIVGAIGLVFFAPIETLPAGSVMAQLMAQSIGVAACILWAFGVAYAGTWILRRTMDIRVSEEQELLGLNTTEHDSTLGTEALRRAMAEPSMTAHLDENAGDESGEIAKAINRMVTNHELALSNLAQGQKRFQDFAETASDIMWETDRAHRITYLSDSFLRKIEVEPEALLEQHLFKVFNVRSDETQEIMGRLSQLKALEDRTVRLRSTDGADHVMLLNGRPAFDGSGAFLGYRGTARDITEKLKAEGHIRFLANHDVLTKLANRRAFNAAVAEAIQKAVKNNNQFAVCVLDLSRFKFLNDSYGHAAGDDVLRAVAKRLQGLVRRSDCVARLGGDEFAILLSAADQTPDTIDRFCVKVIDSIRAPIPHREMMLDVDTCIGVAIYGEHGQDPEDLLTFADLALYKAKDEGPGRFARFEPGLNKVAEKRRLLERELRTTLDQNGLTLAFQPQLDANTDELSGFEALARWQHPVHGAISPSEFIPVAEQCGLMEQLGRVVLEEACRQAVTWPSCRGIAPKVAVNLSAIQFFRDDLVSLVRGILEDTRLPVDRLELEITETILMRDAEHAKKVLRALADLGVSIAIDDFGTGYSSLSYLKRFPIDKLKIDRSFVRDIEHDANDKQITKAIVSLGRSLGMTITAEGVESVGQRNILAAYGCHSLQGFLYSRPVPASEVAEIIARIETGELIRAAHAQPVAA